MATRYIYQITYTKLAYAKKKNIYQIDISFSKVLAPSTFIWLNLTHGMLVSFAMNMECFRFSPPEAVNQHVWPQIHFVTDQVLRFDQDGDMQDWMS